MSQPINLPSQFSSYLTNNGVNEGADSTHCPPCDFTEEFSNIIGDVSSNHLVGDTLSYSIDGRTRIVKIIKNISVPV